MDIQEALKDKVVRTEAMRESFPLFFAYHFWRKFTEFQKDWLKSLQSNKNTMLIAFRASRKTTMVRGYVVRSIVYKKDTSIIWQSYEDTLSAESVREIAKMLCKPSIVEDYGNLFPFESKKEDLAKRSLSNFEATNGVKIASKSLWQTLRGANTYDMQEWMSSRPTLLILDDIDVMKSVTTSDIINANERKILSETIWALDPLKRKIIFLWNVIQEDWVVPRFWRNYKWNHRRNCYWQALFDEKNNNIRPEVFTDDVVEELKADGKVSRQQNYLLIPSTAWSWVFVREYFDYFLLSHFEDIDSPLKKHDLRIWIFVDPAFSTSDSSDDAVVLWVWEHRASKACYLIDWYADTSAPSKTINRIIVMYNAMKDNWFTPEFISVEDVKINKQQTQFINDLRAKLLEFQITIPLYLFQPRQNKNARIKDNLEPIMSMKWFKFSRNLDKNFLFKSEQQLLEYPNGDHDDIIDTMWQSVEVFRKREEKAKPTPRPTVSLLTRKQNDVWWTKFGARRGTVSR